MIERYTRPEMGRIWTEENKLAKWLQVEVAACAAWSELGVIPVEDVAKIRDATFEVDRVAEYQRETHHDMTAFLRSVADSLGPEGRWVHLGLTSSDVMDTALSLQLVEATDLLARDVEALIEVLESRAIEHKNTLMMGRTHGVHAEPTTFGLKLAVWVDEMRRNRKRLAEAREQIAVGKISGAVGTHATVPPFVEETTCRHLGLATAPASNQVLQRDREAHWVSTLAIIAASLEKFATEVRALQKTEVLEVEEPFSEGQTGSSAMPHKRNPEKSERVCGLARVIRGHAVTALENVALWHERDISHSSAERIILPDAAILLDYMLDMFTWIMRGLLVYPENMQENIERSRGLVFSQRVLLSLVEKGLSRESAYKLVQRNAMQAWRERSSFPDLIRADTEVASHLSGAQLEELFDYGYYTRYVDDVFARLSLAS